MKNILIPLLLTIALVGCVTPTKEKKLKATNPPVISNPITSIVATQNSTIKFTVTATGTSLKYQWKRPNGQLIAGATTSALNLTNVQFTNYGNYIVTITNAGGKVSTNALLIVTSTNIIRFPITTNNPIKFDWCTSTSTNIKNYRIYWGTGYAPSWTPNIFSNCNPPTVNGSNWLRTYTQTLNVNSNVLSCIISNFATGTTNFSAVTAIDTTGAESDYSNEAFKYIAIPPPTNTTLNIYSITNATVALITKTYPNYPISILRSTNLFTWSTLLTTNSDSLGNVTYYDTAQSSPKFYRVKY